MKKEIFKNRKENNYCALISLLFAGFAPILLLGQNCASEYNNNNTAPALAGTNCSAFGKFSQINSTSSATNNTSLGWSALWTNSTGNENTAFGYMALYNSNSFGNTAFGYEALFGNTSGVRNTAIGSEALINNTSGYDNTAVGYSALFSNTTEFANTAFGANADIVPSFTNQTSIGYGTIPSAGTDDIVSLGDGNVTIIETSAALIPFGSDARIKDNVVNSEVKGLDFINKLRPVIYNLDVRKITENKVAHLPIERRKIYLDKDFSKATNIRRSGFIAQEVEETAASCGFEFSGINKPSSPTGIYQMSYGQFIMPLVKAVQEQQVMIEELSSALRAISTSFERVPRESTADFSKQNQGIDLAGFEMQVNKPNPFKKETTINYVLPSHIINVALIIANLGGVVMQKHMIESRGKAAITISAEHLTPGIYIYSMIGDGVTLGSKKMILANE